MGMDFSDKVVWITGASSGIGEALASEYVNRGAKVVISSPETDKLNELCDSFNALHPESAIVAPLDLTKCNEIHGIVEKVIELAGKVDILINSAGISQRSLIIETPVEIDRKIFEVNYFGPVILTKSVLPHMISNGGGTIAVISSIVGKFGFPLRSAYSASKHALHGFFETLRAEVKKDNINVTIICPGRVQTNISVNAITKDGKPYGIMDKGQLRGIPAEKCARKIVRAINKKRKEVYIGGSELIMPCLKKYFPFLFYLLLSKVKPA
jgi:dehydrogenase/reductase SDR family protein 7B